MPKLEIADIANLVKNTNKFERISIVLKSSNELEDFLLTLSESFDFTGDTINFIESIIRDEPADLNHDFLKQIAKIKDSRDGFQALLFCLRHFGFEKAEESMQQIFEYKVQPYQPLIEKLLSFRLAGKGKPVKLKKSKEVQVIHRGELSAQRLYAPVLTDLKDMPQALAIYAPEGPKLKRLMKVIGYGFTELHVPREPVQLDTWPDIPRGLYVQSLRKIRHDHPNVEVKKDGVLRIVNIYH
jgi:hypothetical protein